MTDASRQAALANGGPAAEAAEDAFVLVFSLEGRLFGLPLQAVERVVRAVEITPLPTAPAVVRGVINLEGELVPVADIRGRLGLQPKDLALGDQLLVAHTSTRMLAILVDGTHGVIDCRAQEFVPVEDLLPGAGALKGIVKGASGMILIQDPDAFLSLDDEQSYDRALGHGGPGERQEPPR